MLNIIVSNMRYEMGPLSPEEGGRRVSAPGMPREMAPRLPPSRRKVDKAKATFNCGQRRNGVKDIHD